MDAIRTIQCKKEEPSVEGSYFLEKLNICNVTEKTIYVYGREGYTAAIESESYRHPQLFPGVYFTKRIQSPDVKFEDMSLLVEEYPETYRKPRSNISYIARTRIHEELFHNINGMVYVHDYDVVLSVKPPKKGNVHPFSVNGLVDRILNSERKREKPTVFDVTIDIVDNEGTFGDRFINLGGIVHAVRARKEEGLPSGIYAHWVNAIQVKGGPTLTQREYYPLGNVSELPFALFPTPEDARGVDPPKERELEIAESKTELELQKLKAKYEYEQKSLDRKDASESWKFFPAVILGIVGLLKIFI